MNKAPAKQMTRSEEAKAKRALREGGWKSVLPFDLCVDMLICQGYTKRAALRELSSMGRSIDSS